MSLFDVDYGEFVRLSASEAGLDLRTLQSQLAPILKDKVLHLSPETRALIGAFYISAVTPFVPMKTGKLRSSGTATSDGRVWWTAMSEAENPVDYAPIQYTTLFENYTTPGTGPYWNIIVSAESNDADGKDAYDEFIRKITPYVIADLNRGTQ